MGNEDSGHKSQYIPPRAICEKLWDARENYEKIREDRNSTTSEIFDAATVLLWYLKRYRKRVPSHTKRKWEKTINVSRLTLLLEEDCRQDMLKATRKSEQASYGDGNPITTEEVEEFFEGAFPKFYKPHPTHELGW